MKKIFGLLFLPIVLLAESPDKILERYYANMKRVISVKGKIVMEVKRGDSYSYMKGEYCTQGVKMYLKVPLPHDFILAANGKRSFFFAHQSNTIYFYDPDNYPAEYQNPTQQQQQTLDQVPDLQKVGSGYVGWKKMDIYEGRSRAIDQFISKVKIWVDPMTGFLFRIETYDLHQQLVHRAEMQNYREFNGVWLNMKTFSWTRGDREVLETTTEFQDVVVNGPVDEGMFELVIPPGVKVKDLTSQVLKQRKSKE